MFVWIEIYVNNDDNKCIKLSICTYVHTLQTWPEIRNCCASKPESFRYLLLASWEKWWRQQWKNFRSNLTFCSLTSAHWLLTVECGEDQPWSVCMLWNSMRRLICVAQHDETEHYSVEFHQIFSIEICGMEERLWKSVKFCVQNRDLGAYMSLMQNTLQQ